MPIEKTVSIVKQQGEQPKPASYWSPPSRPDARDSWPRPLRRFSQLHPQSGLRLRFCGFLDFRELDLLDVANQFSVLDPARACTNALDAILVTQVVVGVDFDLLLAISLAGSACDLENRVIQTLEGFRAIAQRSVAELHFGKVAIVVSQHANLEVGDRHLIRWFRRSTNGHVDAEIAFGFDNLQCQHEEDQQLEHDINHRCHLRFDLVRFGRFDLHAPTFCVAAKANRWNSTPACWHI